MAIFEFAPAIKNSRKIVKKQSEKVILRLVPDIKSDQVISNKSFVIFIAGIFVAAFLSLLVINTALARDAFLLQELKAQAQLITDQREAILRQVADKSSPDKLAKQASEMGMIASINPYFLDLSAGVE